MGSLFCLYQGSAARLMMNLYCNNCILGSKMLENLDFKFAESLSHRDILSKMTEYATNGSRRQEYYMDCEELGRQFFSASGC